MGVLVCYDDFSYDVVSNYQLRELMEKGSIIGYDNSGDWIKMDELPQRPKKRAAAGTRRASSRKSKTA